MMAIPVKCSCGKILRVPEAHAGKRAKCPGCGQIVRVPVAEVDDVEETTSEDDDYSNMEELLPKRASRPAGARKKSVGKSNRSAKKKSHSSAGGNRTWLIVAGAGGAVIGLVLLVLLGLSLLGSGERDGGAADAGGNDAVKVVRTGTRKQKEFSSGTGSPKTTTEWFEHLRKMHTTDNPTQRIFLKHQAESPENFLGPDPAALPIVFEALAESPLNTYANAILKKFEQSADKPYLDDLIAGLTHSNLEVQIWSVRLLSQYGPAAAEAVPKLGEFVQSPQLPLAKAATTTLGTIGPPALDAITRAFDRDELRWTAATATVRLGPAAAPLVPRLVAMLNAKDRATPNAALTALIAIGPQAEPALGNLEALLISESEKSADVGNFALVQDLYVAIGDAALPVLRQTITSGPAPARKPAFQTLGKFGPKAMPMLSEFASHEEAEVRLLAVQSISTNPPVVELVPVLVKALGDADNEVILQALRGLTSYGPVANSAVSPVLTLVRGKNTSEFNAQPVLGALEAIAPGSKLTISEYGELTKLGTQGARPVLAMYGADELKKAGQPAAAALPVLQESLALIPAALSAIEAGKAAEARYVVLNFTSRSGIPATVKWRPITAEDIASTPNLVALSKQEMITKYEISGYTFDGESAPDLSRFEEQAATWKSLESSLKAAITAIGG